MTLIHSLMNVAGLDSPFIAALLGATLTIATRKYCLQFECYGITLTHHTHETPVPRLGGIAVFLAIGIASMLAFNSGAIHGSTTAASILFGAVPVVLTGAYDDIWYAPPIAKIFGQLAGIAILLGADWHFHGPPGILRAFLVTVWIVVATNSFNLIDGVDGLATSTAMIVSATLAFVNLAAGNIALSLLAIIVFAASFGFLPFNVAGRSKIFLGDCGSLSIGFILAALACESPHELKPELMAVVLFGYPLSETFYSVIRRLLKGRPLFHPDREHLHHKLRHSGFSRIRTVATLCLLGATFACLAAMGALGSSEWFVASSGMVLFLATGKSFGYLNWRNLVRLKRRMIRRRGPDEELPGIAGYLPYK